MSSILTTREKNIFMAKICLETKRFEDMVFYMKQVALNDQVLSIEERNLLSTAYKKVVGSYRKAWQILSNLDLGDLLEGNEEESSLNSKMQLVVNYKNKFEKLMYKYCDEIINVLDKK